MATEALPQTSHDPQFDVDLINFDADISAADKEWPFSATEADPTDVTPANNDSTHVPSLQQPEATGDIINEIDWEDHEQPAENTESLAIPAEQSAARGNSAASPSFDLSTEEPGLALSAEPASTTAHEQNNVETGGKLDDAHSNDTNPHQRDQDTELVEHEITYDEDDDLVEVSKEEKDDTMDDEMLPGGTDEYVGLQTEVDAEVDSSRGADETGLEEGVEGTEGTDALGENEFEVQNGNDQQDDELNNSRADSAAAQDDHSTESQDETGVSAATSLDITVTYKNEEYPLIHGQDSIETQMGFFEDVSALDLTIDNLLAKFREELTDDLGPEDEVVLQVDELGLEYAESTHRDHLSGVTLRQLHEIFDQLAKNQDPDVARTLYTNLIIRPHPARRLEMLIDEAFNGRGLDEFMYCFQPNTGGQQLLHDDKFEEVYESSENEGAQSAEAEDEINAPSHVDDNQSENDRESQLEYHENPIEEELEDVDADGADDDAKYYDDYVDLDDTTVPSQAPELQETIQITDENDEDLEVIEVGKTDLLDPTIQNDGAYESYDDEQNVDESANTAENAGFDLIELTDDDDAAVGAEQADSSATATLTGDGENEIDLGESDLNDMLNTEAIEGGSPVNPSNEIDWRDFTEENESGSKDTLGSSGKRPRPDGVDGEELLSEGQNDVKRRRSQ